MAPYSAWVTSYGGAAAMTTAKRLSDSFSHPWLRALTTPWPISFCLGVDQKAGVGTAEPAAYGNPPAPQAHSWNVVSLAESRHDHGVTHVPIEPPLG